MAGIPFGFWPMALVCFDFDFRAHMTFLTFFQCHGFPCGFACVSFVLVFRIPHQSILMRLNDPIVLSSDLRMVWNFCCSVWARPSRCEDLNLTLLNLAWRLALVYLHAIGLVFNSPSLVKITCHDVLVLLQPLTGNDVSHLGTDKYSFTHWVFMRNPDLTFGDHDGDCSLTHQVVWTLLLLHKCALSYVDESVCNECGWL